MTTEKMQDVIWAETVQHHIKNIDQYGSWTIRELAGLEKYLRAKPVEDLLKQCLPYLYNAENWELVNDIEKILGEK